MNDYEISILLSKINPYLLIFYCSFKNVINLYSFIDIYLPAWEGILHQKSLGVAMAKGWLLSVAYPLYVLTVTRLQKRHCYNCYSSTSTTNYINLKTSKALYVASIISLQFSIICIINWVYSLKIKIEKIKRRNSF